MDGMAYICFMNRKSIKERALILSLLVEGNSLRSTSRVAGCSINTVTRLLVETGEACSWFQDQALVDLPCKRIQVDEIWSFVYAKQKNVPQGKEGDAGDVWTWTAIDADTKLVPSWRIGSRNAETARDFIYDLASRMANRIQITSDGHHPYIEAIEGAFGQDVDYAMLVKLYGETTEKHLKYRSDNCIGYHTRNITGTPERKHVSTSFCERQNLTMRMSMRRFTRSINGFSKKVQNHAHAIALHFMNYNFVRIHKSLRISPAMAAEVSDRLWDLEDVVKMVDTYWDGKSN